MDKVRVGIVGVGNMGSGHVGSFADGKIKNAELVAVCDLKEDRLAWAKEKKEDLVLFSDVDEMIASGVIDAIIIATPHYLHPVIAQKAFAKGVHVLSEKPAGVFTSAVREMNEAAEKSGLVFGIMFNQRKRAVCQTLKRNIEAGVFGNIRRVTWIISSWYRSQSYYDSGDWRATWSGEGGGVLMNQCPNNLDLWQWFFGMPKSIWTTLSFGKYHDIEVEDDVTAVLEYDNGMVGTFITSTGLTPGTDRLEINCDMGRVIMEDNRIFFDKNVMSEQEFTKTYKGGFGAPEFETIEIPVEGDNDQHVGILNDWADAIVFGKPLWSPGVEGIKGLTLCNGMYLSGWTGEKVTLPLDEERFNALLQEKIKNSRRKETTGGATFDLDGTYNK